MKVGKYYLIDFLDHSMGLDKLVACRVIGKLVLRTRKEIKICIWEVLNLNAEDTENNKETISIVRSTITSWKKIAV